MLDLFAIFSKGGVILWCFPGTVENSLNALIRSVVLQERGGLESFTHENLRMKYKMDNEFELVFVVAYQHFLQLSYVDKFLNDIQMEFRNRYKDELYKGQLCLNLDGFLDFFKCKLKEEEEKEAAKSGTKKMRTYLQSVKSQKTVASLYEERKPDVSKQNINKNKSIKHKDSSGIRADTEEVNVVLTAQEIGRKMKGSLKPNIKRHHEKKQDAKKVKQNREWDNCGDFKNMPSLDYSDNIEANGVTQAYSVENVEHYASMRGELKNLEDEVLEEDCYDEENLKEVLKAPSAGIFGSLKSLVTSKVLTKDDIEAAIDKMKDHLIAKNVAAEIASKICESIVTKLEGKVLGTFKTVASTVRQSLEESCIQLLTPHKRIDILRDALDAKLRKTPFIIVFCGVNGVGKSTNLAKIAYWLIENDLRVLIAACDTFRAGAVEQLRTHCQKLNSTRHCETMVQLYEKGYGKDAAGVAMEAINYARDVHFDVVLVDTAGRMQGNEPLMRSLAKLIKVNQPNLVLFVGEALVGNDAVDQLVKFNQALADYSNMENPHLIDGIVLTKFDTIDDKVGAAISMTYITGQPIVFVGTGQTYSDLKVLNARSVVQSLMKA